MKKIVLKSLPAGIEELIRDRADKENLSHAGAIVEFLHDAEIECAAQHDIELMKSWQWEDDDVQAEKQRCHHCCCHHCT